MKLQLIARHLRDDQDHEIAWSDDPVALVRRMAEEIESNRSEGSNWRYAITPTNEEYL
ncbi:hypothetical protein [Mesorhizobium sp.]|uniref:hypothetical protein n=1 Tax=Mesorhizobium sp. TaxID=1871066 RepID=UPI0025D6DEB9|nr:hypothetical protein [Mesorhizobium sp.]